jgi:hypothetical protein
MNLSFRQCTVVLMALTVLFDEVAKTSNPEMQHEILEVSEAIQNFVDENYAN